MKQIRVILSVMFLGIVFIIIPGWLIYKSQYLGQLLSTGENLITATAVMVDFIVLSGASVITCVKYWSDR